jgi:hypothetical protein
LLVQGGVVEDLGCDTGAVDRRIRVKRSDEDLDLRVYTLLLVGIGGNNGEGSDTLTIQTLRMLAQLRYRG